jgi:hypothetical protein
VRCAPAREEVGDAVTGWIYDHRLFISRQAELDLALDAIKQAHWLSTDGKDFTRELNRLASRGVEMVEQGLL